MHRRTYLLTAVAGTAAVAGCLGADDDDEPTDNTSDDGGPGGSGGNGPSNPPEPIETGTFDDFEDLSTWSVMDGSLSPDSDRSVVGSQSGLLTASRSEQRVMVKREFDEPRDLSNELPGLAVASDGVNAVVQLTDVDSDRLILRAAVEEDGPLVARNFGVVEEVGDPDLSEISYVKVSAWAGEEREANMWCDDLRFVSRPETGTVVLQFDNGFETAATEAAPILEEYDYPATAFVHTDRVGEDGRLDTDQLADLADAGWTIGSHGTDADDLGRLDESEQEAQITGAVEWLDDHGFGDGAPFAYPNASYDETTLELVEENHDLAFASGYPVHGYVSNPHLCPRAVHPSADEAEQILDRTATYRGITTLTYRDLDDSLDEFEQTMEYLHDLESNGDIEVVLPGEIESEYLD